VSAFHLDADASRLASRPCLTDLADLLDESRAEVEGGDKQLAEALWAAEAGDVVEEVGDVGGDVLVGGEEAKVLVDPGCQCVVVAGPEVDVPAQQPALAAHDQRHLRVDLHVRESVDDVDACTFERSRPFDVPMLIEAGLQLDQADALLAGLGALDQRRDKWGVVARAIYGRLDRGDVRVVGRSTHDRLEARREGVVRVVDEDVTARDLAEHVSVLDRGEAGVRARHPGLFTQLGAIERGQLREVSQIEEALQTDLELGHRPQPRAQAGQHAVGHRVRDLEPDDFAETASAELELDCFEKVVSLIGDVEIGISRHPEGLAFADLHLREEPVEEMRHRVFERDPALRTDRKKTGEAFGNLHAREALLTCLAIAHEDGHAQRESRDVRKRLARPDREGGQHRIDLALEETFELGALVVVAVVNSLDADPALGERGHEVVRPEAGLRRAQLADAPADLGQRCQWRPPVGRAHREPGGGLAHQTGHPHHEELVEVRGEDRAELHALEEGDLVVGGKLEQARIEVEPRELAVEEACRARDGSRLLGWHYRDGADVRSGMPHHVAPIRGYKVGNVS
jgi:hypothetical protein